MTIEVDGISLAFDDSGGEGVPVVCLHAIGHDASDFEVLRARLHGRRVIALDWPGQGRSAPDREPPTTRRYAQLLGAFLDGLGLERAVLVGNSIGGGAALRYAGDRPERVAGLVLANPSGLDRGGWVKRFATRMMARFFAAGARGARWFPRLFAAYYRMVLRKPAAAQARERIIASGKSLAPLLAQAWSGFGEPDDDLTALAPRVDCPVLFTWAVRDRFIQLRRNLPAIRAFPRATLVKFDAGHSPQLEAPESFGDAVAEFVAACPAGT
jgi:pimeloyl-ACP methyl ester carboxylesterase